jgi:hypothetical protein
MNVLHLQAHVSYLLSHMSEHVLTWFGLECQDVSSKESPRPPFLSSSMTPKSIHQKKYRTFAIFYVVKICLPVLCHRYIYICLERNGIFYQVFGPRAAVINLLPTKYLNSRFRSKHTYISKYDDLGYPTLNSGTFPL